LSHIETKLEIDDLPSAYSLTTKLRSRLIAAICERKRDFPAKITKGEISGKTITLTINEPLPNMKELTASVKDYWIDLIHSAIAKLAERQKPPYFEKAFVLIEITTPKYSDNSRLWDTSNRAVNLIINNLKGIFFEDDNHEHMAFGVVGKWGEGGTVVRIMPFERFDKLLEGGESDDT
jgi:hypothetical protein